MDFKEEAIKAVGAIVKARNFCIRNNKGLRISSDDYKPVMAQYEAYKSKWSERGIAKFMVSYEYNLRLMATGGKNQIHKLSTLIEIAKSILNNNELCQN